jgi:hypothetical protein
MGALIVMGQHGADGKTVADPMLAGGAVDAEDLSHDPSPFVGPVVSLFERRIIQDKEKRSRHILTSPS